MPSKHTCTPGNTSRNLVAEAKKYYEKCYAKTMIFMIFIDFHDFMNKNWTKTIDRQRELSRFPGTICFLKNVGMTLKTFFPLCVTVIIVYTSFKELLLRNTLSLADQSVNSIHHPKPMHRPPHF